MNHFSTLEKNIIDFIKEEQLKLGYQKESIRIYYFLSSLNRCLHTDCDVPGMLTLLQDFRNQIKERLGTIDIYAKKDRFCFVIPPEGTEYVHKEAPDDPFLRDFIRVISTHGSDLNDCLRVFKKYSDHVHVEDIHNDDFDYLIYFEDGIPNDYRYCIKIEDLHAIYHRFTIGDYEDLFLS